METNTNISTTHIPLSLLGDIFGIAAEGATAAVNRDPELYEQLTGKPMDAEQQRALDVADEELCKRYIEKGKLLDSPDLTPRQRQVAAQIGAVVALQPDNRYAVEQLTRECHASTATVTSVLMVMTGIPDLVAFKGPGMLSGPLLMRHQYRRRQPYYKASPALQWLAKNPQEAPIGLRNALGRYQSASEEA
jgi:hypothetical protein